MTDLPDEVVATLRVKNAALAAIGSETDNCLECGATVVVSPATRAGIQIGALPDYIVCLECIAEAQEADA